MKLLTHGSLGEHRRDICDKMPERDLDLEEDCPSLKGSPYKITSPRDPQYNCVAFAVGDLKNFWYDLTSPAAMLPSDQLLLHATREYSWP